MGNAIWLSERGKNLVEILKQDRSSKTNDQDAGQRLLRLLSHIKIKTINADFTDCVVIEVVDRCIVIMAVYIPPSNTYHKDEYFDNNRIMLYTLGKSPKKGYDYILNPDPTVNQNGRLLIKILEEYDNLNIVNGIVR